MQFCLLCFICLAGMWFGMHKFYFFRWTTPLIILFSLYLVMPSFAWRWFCLILLQLEQLFFDWCFQALIFVQCFIFKMSTTLCFRWASCQQHLVVGWLTWSLSFNWIFQSICIQCDPLLLEFTFTIPWCAFYLSRFLIFLSFFKSVTIWYCALHTDPRSRAIWQRFGLMTSDIKFTVVSTVHLLCPNDFNIHW